MPRSLCLTLCAGAVLLSASRTHAQRADSARAARDTARTAATPVGGRAGIAPAPQQVREARPPVSATRAFLYSLAVPGLGQSALRRPNAGAFYFGLEMLAIGMAIKSSYDLRLARERSRDSVVLRYELDPDTGLPVIDPETSQPKVAEYARNRYDAERIRARRTHFEDWIAFLIFNHLFSGADAFVSAQLWDLPTQVGFQPAPGGAALGVRVRF
ncbi:MAG TPA: hypothetical protein VJ717_21170 [Gemmatimonadaceae bacterium]|nr:hypothetical protein [Gemmatimonadaceae bacterium]